MTSHPALFIAQPDGQRRALPFRSGDEDRALDEVLAAHGITLNTRCGRRGLCRGCQVELLEGSLRDGDQTITATPAAPAKVRACRMSLPPSADIPSSPPPPLIRIPAHGHLDTAPQVGETFVIDTTFDLDPLWHASQPNTLDVGCSMLDVGRSGRSPAPPPPPATVFAIDIGTTTVVVLLADPATGEVLARAGGFNAQIRLGDNVLTRIQAASTPATLAALRTALIEETLPPLIARACAACGRPPSSLIGGTIAGNTT
ncbi:2Fe-2S iron-sulfur cluster-binding protein, partial [Geminisphaera colitermitum]|uniref:2Fe-2S iron-sulfur cluster-binding protein n=1 Tax=Geminisphaera colitermitum TaxID=1148786 RepID=UPI0005B832A7